MITPILVATSLAIAVLFVGGVATRIGPWFHALRKPAWNPPNWLFGPMWTTIAALAVWSAVLAWTRAPDAHARIAVLFATNAIFHMAWSPLFFTLRRPDWALVEVPLLWLSVLALIVGLAPISTFAALLLAPYLAWVTVAAALNLAIVRLNRPFGRNSLPRKGVLARLSSLSEATRGHAKRSSVGVVGGAGAAEPGTQGLQGAI